MASRSLVTLLLLVSAFWTRYSLAVVTPTAALLQWSAFEMGAMISWNIDTMAGTQGCDVKKMKSLPDPKLFDTAEHVDFESWARVMQATGIKYCVLTVKHGCGFTLWPSKVHDIPGLPAYNYTIESNPLFANRDLVTEYMVAMKKFGIRPGFYYSLGSNAYLGVSGGKVSPEGTVPLPGQVLLPQSAYYEVVYQHMMELLTTYPNLTEIWYDGGVPAPIRDRLTAAYAKYAPDTVVFQGFGVTPNAVRWPGTESGIPTQDMYSTTDSYGDPNPNGSYWHPAECDTPLQNGDTWFFNKDVGPRSLEELKGVYLGSVGNNCNLMLNLAPDTTGVVHYQDTYRALGDFISTCYPSNPANYVAHVSSPPLVDSAFALASAAPATVDRVVMMEDQTHGECILGYNVEVYDGKTMLYSTVGRWVGHKRVVMLPKAYAVTGVRVIVTHERPDCPAKLTLLAATHCI